MIHCKNQTSDTIFNYWELYFAKRASCLRKHRIDIPMRLFTPNNLCVYGFEVAGKSGKELCGRLFHAGIKINAPPSRGEKSVIKHKEWQQHWLSFQFHRDVTIHSAQLPAFAGHAARKRSPQAFQPVERWHALFWQLTNRHPYHRSRIRRKFL
jgi:hypothetical protein